MKPLAYDAKRFEPAAPVVPIVLSNPSDVDRVEVAALIDTGADVSLIPVALARALAMPQIDRVRIRGIGDEGRDADVYAAVVRVGRLRVLARLIALGPDALLGRDLLERLVLVLDGPQRRLTVRIPRSEARTR